MPREVYRVDFIVSASLDYADKEFAPEANAQVERIAERAVPKLRYIVETLTGAETKVHIVYALAGSAELGLGGRSLYDSYDEWIQAKDMLVDLVVKTEEWFGAELRIQEGLARERVTVSARFYPPQAHVGATAPATQPPPAPVTSPASATPLADEVQKQFHRTIAVGSIVCFICLLFGVVLTGATLGFSALREEVSLLRQEIATRATPPATQQQPIIVSGPPAQVTVIAPSEPRSRRYRSRPD